MRMSIPGSGESRHERMASPVRMGDETEAGREDVGPMVEHFAAVPVGKSPCARRRVKAVVGQLTADTLPGDGRS